MIGMILGDRYELIEVIGEGGMAIVYKARDLKLNRLVAVKVLKKEFTDNTDISQKFKKEATAIANLSDMNIVNVLDVGHEENENMDYFVMEFVDGKTLKDIIISNGKIGWSTAVAISIQVAKALDCAHRNGIIHRDVKPQNILITEHGDVKVTDFGIAKSATSSTITNTTTIMGSAHYLSPEQAKGTFIDFRTDLYSLGIVLYEMVTGKLPFEGESPVTIALKHIQEEALEPKKVNDFIPESLNNFIMKAISKEPILRYQSVKEMIVDLQKIKANPNTIINSKSDAQGGKTIVMAPIKVDPNNKKVQKEVVKYYKNDYDDEFEDDKRNSRNRKGIIILSIIGVILLFGVGVFAASFINGNKNETFNLPNIVGMTMDEAKKIIEPLGLKIEAEGTQISEKPEGEILKTSPEVDFLVQKGDVIKVIISGGVEKIVLKDFRGYEENVIKQYLDSKGLIGEFKYEYSDNIEKGYFISQEPKANTEVTKDEIIYITISKGPEVKLVMVKNYIGYKIVDAKKELEGKKFIVNITEKETNDSKLDEIVLDQPVKNIEVKEGSEVTLVVGKYIEPTVDITQLLSEGMLLSDAVNILNSQKINYSIIGGMPQQTELEHYKVATFTQTIKEGGTVKIEIEKIETAPVDKSEQSELNNG